MKNFSYVKSNSETEVVSMLSRDNGSICILSGGTDLLPQLREGHRQANIVLDIKEVPGATELAYEPAMGLWLGAAVPCYRICENTAVARVYPGLIDAISLIGGTAIQGRASVGGNLCNASPAADSIPALIVHSAICIIAGPGGRREIFVEEFCTAPGQNVLKRGEFLLALRVPPPPAYFGAGYLRFIPRNEMDIAVVGAGASVVLNKDRTTFVSARIALSAVATTPLYVPEAGEYLKGKAITGESMREAARIAQSVTRPISDMRGTVVQRKHLAGVLTRRVLEKAVERAKS